jgi:hypothetical protein
MNEIMVEARDLRGVLDRLYRGGDLIVAVVPTMLGETDGGYVVTKYSVCWIPARSR